MIGVYMKNWFTVSQSKVSTWRKCRRAYWYRYVEKLRRKFVVRPLRFGKIVHEMVDEGFSGRSPFKLLKKIEKEQGPTFAKLREEYGEIISDIRVIMVEYYNYWEEKGDHLKVITLKKKQGEFIFELEIAPGIKVNGRIDRFVEAKKMTWLLEHKTFRVLPNTDHRWRNLQSVVYVKISELLDLPKVDGMLWDYIGSKPPSLPQLLKDGNISAKRIRTLPTRIEEFAEEHDLNVDSPQIQKMIKTARSMRPEWFQRIYNTIKPAVVEEVWADFIETAKEMKELHGKDKARNMGRHCEWCDYEGLCRASLLGLDTKSIRKKEYEVHEKLDEIEVDFEG